MIYRILKTIFIICLIVAGLIWFGNYYSQELQSAEPSAISTVSSSSNPAVSQAQQRLAYCSNVLAYAVNYYLLLNEVGTAKVLVLQQARTYGALLYLNVSDFKKSIELGKSVGPQVKEELNSDQSLIPALIDACMIDSKNYIDRYKINGKRTPDDGTYYQDFVQYLAKKNQEQLGLD